MAWIDAGSCYMWDVSYNDWVRAAQRAIELSTQYKVLAETRQTDEGKHEVITRNEITEEHSVACRCRKCVEL